MLLTTLIIQQKEDHSRIAEGFVSVFQSEVSSETDESEKIDCVLLVAEIEHACMSLFIYPVKI